MAPLTNFPNGVTSFGVPLIGGLIPSLLPGDSDDRRYLFVDGNNGRDGNDGLSADTPKATIQAAVNIRQVGDVILVAPLARGAGYNETVTITRKRAGVDDDSGGPLTLVGVGPRGSVSIAPSAAGAEGLENREDDVTIINVGVAAPTAGDFAIRNYGARFRAYGCKFEGADTAGAALILGPGTVAQVDVAFSHGDAGDCLFEDCEFAWTFDAVRLVASDFGAVTQAFFRDCRFHNYTNAAFAESTGSGGAAGVLFRNLDILRCFFDDVEGGAAPTFYFDLNSDNANDGVVAGCWFPVALASGGKNVVSTALHWVGNFHTGGISTGQPS